MAIYDFFVSRNNAVSNTAAYIGHAGRLFYNSDNGVIKISDGVTPGGVFIPYNIATTTTIGGIKAGPGANVSLDGTLTIDTAGLPLSFGDFTANVNILTTVNPDEDMVLATNGTAEVQLVGNVGFYRPNSLLPQEDHRFFFANKDGQIKISVPASDPTAGAVEIIGSTSGFAYPPVNSGVILHLTGNNGDASRFYNDGVGGFASFVGRRLNGNVLSPTAVKAGDEIIRISSTGYNGTTIPGSGSARIVYQAVEDYTATAQGSNISIWTCAIGSNVLSKIVSVDSASGLTATKGTIQGNLIAGNLQIGSMMLGNNVIYSSTTGSDITIGQSSATANIVINRTTAINKDTYISGNVFATGQVTAKNYRGNTRDAGTLGAGGTLTIDYATDHHVLVNITGAITIAHTNIAAGRNVKVIIVNAVAGQNYAVNTGVPDLNATGGNATANLNSNRMGVYEFISFGTSTTTLYVSVNK